MIQKLVAAFLVLAGLVSIGAAIALLHGPHMRWQASLRSHDAPVPPMPSGTVPMHSTSPAASGEMAETAPLPAAVAVEYGQTYYAYYCVYCHGPTGDGDGPVGESHLPKPADLRLPRVQQLTDDELTHAMLFGTGHEPVLENVVQKQHRQSLVSYVRQLK